MMSESQRSTVNSHPGSETGSSDAVTLESRRSTVPLDHLVIRVDTDVYEPSVVTERGGAKIIASALSDFVEIAALTEGERVPLVSFSLFNELRSLSPSGRPINEHSFTTDISPHRALKITIRSVNGPDDEPAYELGVVPNQLRVFLPTGNSLFNWHNRTLRWVTAVVAVALGAAILFGVLWRRGFGPSEKAESKFPSPAQSPSISPSPLTPHKLELATASPGGIEPAGNPDTIIDGNMVIRVRPDAPVQGLENLPLNIASQVKAALADPLHLSVDSRYQPPTKGFTLMGQGANTRDTVLKSPVGRNVREQQPTLAWTELKVASSYEVTVRDLSTDRIVASTKEPVTATNWTVDRRLERGRLYGWFVVAKKDGVQVRIPTAGMGLFKVLDDAGERTLLRAEAEAPGSRLVRGVLLYRLGLIDEARRDFSSLQKANPESKTATALSRHAKEKKRLGQP
jgi:hypothetical protein